MELEIGELKNKLFKYNNEQCMLINNNVNNEIARLTRTIEHMNLLTIEYENKINEDINIISKLNNDIDLFKSENINLKNKIHEYEFNLNK